MPQAVLLGTENRAKQERLAWLLEGLGLEIVTPAQASLAAPEMEEDGPSHLVNAKVKAEVWSRAFTGMAIVSDGGLVIPALKEKWDALRTRRFFEGDDVERARELLSLMAHLDGKDRRAYWVEALALANRGRLLHTVEARSGDGVIAQDVDEALIKDGFWLGALWYFPQLGKRYAELTPEELSQMGDHWTGLKEQMTALLLPH